MGSLPIQDLLKGDDGAALQYSLSDYHHNSESPTELYPRAPSLPHQHSYPYLHPLHPQQKGRPVELDRRSLPFHGGDLAISQARKTWASSVDLAYIDPEAIRFGALEDARRGSSAISTHSIGRRKSPLRASRERDSRYPDFGGLKSRKPHHHSDLSVGSGITGAYDRIKERQRKLQVLRQAVDGEYTFLNTKVWCKSNWNVVLLVCLSENPLPPHWCLIPVTLRNPQSDIHTQVMLWLATCAEVKKQSDFKLLSSFPLSFFAQRMNSRETWNVCPNLNNIMSPFLCIKASLSRYILNVAVQHWGQITHCIK